jgi:hypothetical protein
LPNLDVMRLNLGIVVDDPVIAPAAYRYLAFKNVIVASLLRSHARRKTLRGDLERGALGGLLHQGDECADDQCQCHKPRRARNPGELQQHAECQQNDSTQDTAQASARTTCHHFPERPRGNARGDAHCQTKNHPTDDKQNLLERIRQLDVGVEGVRQEQPGNASHQANAQAQRTTERRCTRAPGAVVLFEGAQRRADTHPHHSPIGKGACVACEVDAHG